MILESIDEAEELFQRGKLKFEHGKYLIFRRHKWRIALDSERDLLNHLGFRKKFL
jgi:hypothetical protein